MSIVLSNTPRQCGTLRKGGCYLQGETGPGGWLAPWTWALGESILNQRSTIISVDVPPRRQISIDPAMTFHNGRMIQQDAGLLMRLENLSEIPRQIMALSQDGLIDHVGSNNYTAAQFAQETVEHGPSRRIAPDIAREVASKWLLPFRIFFTHSDVPVFQDRLDRNEWVHSHEIPQHWMQNCWDHAQWSGTVYGWNGSEQYMSHVLRYLDANTSEWGGLQKREQIIGYSWITRVVYVLQDDEDEAPEELVEAGVVVGRIDE